MVYILSRQKDLSTIKFIDWLIYYNIEFKRINSPFDIIDEMNFDILEFENSICSDSFYFHGGRVDVMVDYTNGIDKTLNTGVSNHISNDCNIIFKHYLQKRANSKSIKIFGNYHNRIYGKLETLEFAINCGLKVPPTAIISTKSKLEYYRKTWNEIITKSVENPIRAESETHFLKGQYTQLVDVEKMEINEVFLPTLIQKKIDKDYEIKCCYFNNNFYSIAIFSQENTESTIDSRIETEDSKIRIIPYVLPSSITKQISSLMEKLEYNFGTIDLIKYQNDYIFLEVNPFGQYGFISEIGNYNIEKIILKYLTNVNEK